MKAFLFSRRFLIPLFITWAGYLVYLGWKLRELYKDDFSGKGLPSSLLFKWLWNVVGELMLLSFLLAFVVAMTFYGHYNMKKNKSDFKPFSPINLMMVFVIALTGFLYTSFNEPRHYLKSMHILSSVVYARSNNEYNLVIKKPIDDYKSERMMTLPELYKRKAILRKQKSIESPGSFFDEGNASLIKKVNWQIARKYALPFSIFLFYIIGVFMGMSFYKVHWIIPILISWLLLFGGWYYCNRLFEFWFKNGKVNVFLGVFGPGILVFVLLGCWYFGLRHYGIFKKKQEESLTDLTLEE